MNWVGYYIVNMSIGYCIDEKDKFKIITTRSKGIAKQ